MLSNRSEFPSHRLDHFLSNNATSKSHDRLQVTNYAKFQRERERERIETEERMIKSALPVKIQTTKNHEIYPRCRKAVELGWPCPPTARHGFCTGQTSPGEVEDQRQEKSSLGKEIHAHKKATKSHDERGRSHEKQKEPPQSLLHPFHSMEQGVGLLHTSQEARQQSA